MIVLGVDPGSRITGYGILNYENRRYDILDHGVITSSSNDALELRYYKIFENLDQLIQKYDVQYLSIETQFVHKNVQSTLKLGMARGAALIAAAKNNIPVHEYAPARAKKAVVGKGSATKQQIQHMIRLLLKLEKELSEDVSDAFSLALCHIHTLHFQSPIQAKR